MPKRRKGRTVRKIKRFFKSRRGKKIMGGVAGAIGTIGLGMLAARSGSRTLNNMRLDAGDAFYSKAIRNSEQFRV